MAEMKPSWLPVGYEYKPLGSGKYEISGQGLNNTVVNTRADGFSIFDTRQFLEKHMAENTRQARRAEGLQPERDAPTKAQFFAAGMPPEQRARYYAKEMGLPPDRLRQYKGRYGYLADDGQFVAFEGSKGLDVLTGAAPLVLEAGGAIGIGALGSLGGPAGAVAGSAAGAAGGNLLATEISEQLTGQDVPLEQEILRAGGAAALDVAGFGAGLLLGKLGKILSKSDLQRVASEYGDLVKRGMPEIQAQDAMLAKVNKELGTNLKFTPTERLAAAPGAATRAVPDQQYGGSLRRFAPKTSQFYEKRAGEAIEAYDKYLARNFPHASGRSPRKAGKEAIGAARQAISKGDEALRVQARELFNEAFAETPYVETSIVDDSLKLLQSFGNSRKTASRLAKELNMARKTYGTGDDAVAFDFAKFEDIHDNIKGMLSHEIAKAPEGSPLRAKLAEAKRMLDAQLDRISPRYKTAKDLWRELKQGQKEAYEALGEMARTSPRRYSAIARDIIEKYDPVDIRNTRNLLREQPNGERIWSDLTRNYIRDIKNEVVNKTSVPGTRYTNRDIKLPERFAAYFLADKRQKGLKAALTRKQYDGLTNLSEVMLRMAKASTLKPEAIKEGTTGGFLQAGLRKGVHEPVLNRYYQTFDRIAQEPSLLEQLNKIDLRNKTLTSNIQIARRVLDYAALEEVERDKDMQQNLMETTMRGLGIGEE